MVFADKFKLDEVLRNLISNALKFSSRNSRVSVRVGFRPLVMASLKVGNPMIMAQSASSRGRRGSVNRAATSLIRHTSLAVRGFLLSHRQRKVAGSDGSNREGVVRDPSGVDDDIEAGVNNTRASNCPHSQHPHGERRLSSAYSPSNGRAPGGSVDTSRGRDLLGELIVVVTDIGVGISKENQKLLFQEGMQFDPEKLQTGGGSGFGLYISKSIVELHGGSMEVFSEGEGKGCSFLYRIPMTRQRPELGDSTVVPTGAIAASLHGDRVSRRGSDKSGDHRTHRERGAHTLRVARGGVETGPGGGPGGVGRVSAQKSDHSLPPPVSQSPLVVPIRPVSFHAPHISEFSSDDDLRQITSSKVIPLPSCACACACA